jgi:hypothetical protein
MKFGTIHTVSAIFQFPFHLEKENSSSVVKIHESSTVAALAGGRMSLAFVYYESMKRKLKIKPIYECRCDGRLQTKRFTRLSYTGLVVELEHLKIKTRLTNEKFASVKGECEI